MTMLTRERAKPKRAVPDVKLVADDVVTANSLATHLGMTRQNMARLTAEAIIEQRSDGCYDQTASRLIYLKHLRSEHRRSPRAQADADHVKVKTEMLQLRLLEKRNGLVKREDVDALIDQMAGTVHAGLSRNRRGGDAGPARTQRGVYQARGSRTAIRRCRRMTPHDRSCRSDRRRARRQAPSDRLSR